MQTLIIRPGAIGDTLLTLPVLQYLRTQQEAIPLTFVGNAQVLPLIKAFSLSEECASYSELRWGHLFLPGLEQSDSAFHAYLQRFTRAICWLRDEQDTVQHNLQAAGIEQIRIVPGQPSETETAHITDYLMQSLAPILSSPPTMPLPWQAPADYEWQMPDTEEQARTRYVIIHPGSGGKAKRWPLAAFSKVIRRLWQRNIPVLLLTGPAEQDLHQQLQRLLASAPRHLLQQMEEAPLLSIASRMRQARCYLGNDSGLTHLAALLGVPTVALFGPSDPRRWQPIGARVYVLYAHDLQAITPDQVLQTLLAISSSQVQSWQ